MCTTMFELVVDGLEKITIGKGFGDKVKDHVKYIQAHQMFCHKFS